MDFKEAGNSFFKAGEYSKAQEQYMMALTQSPSEPLRVTLLLNLAQCALKMLDYERAAPLCDAALRSPAIDGGARTKALFRRAKARAGLGFLVDAREDCDEALGADPGNRDVAELRAHLVGLLEDEAARAARASAGPAMQVPDDLPPLDDMEEYLEQRGVDVKRHVGAPAPTKRIPKKEGEDQFKPGFLAGKSLAPEGEDKKGAGGGAEDVIRPKDPGANPLRMTEVQEALTKNKGEWMTPTFVEALSKNEALVRGMADPRMAKAIDEFSKDPASAQKKYAGDPKVIEFLTSFSALLGDHFTSIADAKEKSAGGGGGGITGQQQQQQVPVPARKKIMDEDDIKAEEIVKNEKARTILLDPAVQELIGLLREGKQADKRFGQIMAMPGMGQKIGFLVENGVLGVQK